MKMQPNSIYDLKNPKKNHQQLEKCIKKRYIYHKFQKCIKYRYITCTSIYIGMLPLEQYKFLVIHPQKP